MEIRYIKYTGPLQDGEVTVKQEHIKSPYRVLKVSTGKIFEIGKDIPQRVAKNIMDMMSHSFEMGSVILDDDGEVKENIKGFMAVYKDRYGENAEVMLPTLTIDAVFAMFDESDRPSVLGAILYALSLQFSPEEIAAKIAEVKADMASFPATAAPGIEAAAEEVARLGEATANATAAVDEAAAVVDRLSGTGSDGAIGVGEVGETPDGETDAADGSVEGNTLKRATPKVKQPVRQKGSTAE